MTLNTFTSGVNTSFSSQLNNNFQSFSINTIYTGSAFNASSSGGTASNSYEMALTAASLKKAAYLRIVCNVVGSGDSNGSNAVTSNLKIEQKYTGGSYSTIYDQTIYQEGLNDSRIEQTCVDYIYTLNANDIANGVTLKFTGTASCTAGSSASVGNIQTYVQNLG